MSILDSSLDRLLDEQSNLIQFKNRFKLIATSQNYTQALERIYGSNDLVSIDSMNKHGRLQEGAFKIYKTMGVGIGIMRKEARQ